MENILPVAAAVALAISEIGLIRWIDHALPLRLNRE